MGTFDQVVVTLFGATILLAACAAAYYALVVMPNDRRERQECADLGGVIVRDGCIHRNVFIWTNE